MAETKQSIIYPPDATPRTTLGPVHTNPFSNENGMKLKRLSAILNTHDQVRGLAPSPVYIGDVTIFR